MLYRATQGKGERMADKKETVKKTEKVDKKETKAPAKEAGKKVSKKEVVKKTPAKKVTEDSSTSRVAKDKVVKKKTTEKSETTKDEKVVKKSQLEKRGKKYQESYKKLEKDREYPVEEAVILVKETADTKFDSSVEIHLNLNIDTKNPDHQIRGSISLPAGLGKEKKVAVVCKEDQQKEAEGAGADVVGDSELIRKIVKGDIDFEVLVSTPDMMGELARAGKVLGPKGLMPNPKDNTVTNDIKATIADIKKGRAEYRVDTYGIVHAVVGKVSFDKTSLLENVEVFLKEMHDIKPASVKPPYIKSIYLTSTMGPSIKITEK